MQVANTKILYQVTLYIQTFVSDSPLALWHAIVLSRLGRSSRGKVNKVGPDYVRAVDQATSVSTFVTGLGLKYDA